MNHYVTAEQVDAALKIRHDPLKLKDGLQLPGVIVRLPDGTERPIATYLQRDETTSIKERAIHGKTTKEEKRATMA